jgi:hypothetical protein
MRIPENQNIIILEEKLLNYLFSNSHPIGRFKARFFESIGFNSSNIDLFMEKLITIVRENEIESIIKTKFGIKFIIDGDLISPGGKLINLRTIWIKEKDEAELKFITAYPKSKNIIEV